MKRTLVNWCCAGRAVPRPAGQQAAHGWCPESPPHCPGVGCFDCRGVVGAYTQRVRQGCAWESLAGHAITSARNSPACSAAHMALRHTRKALARRQGAARALQGAGGPLSRPGQGPMWAQHMSVATCCSAICKLPPQAARRRRALMQFRTSVISAFPARLWKHSTAVPALPRAILPSLPPATRVHPLPPLATSSLSPPNMPHRLISQSEHPAKQVRGRTGLLRRRSVVGVHRRVSGCTGPDQR